MPYLGTKRPSDGADMRAFRGARCRDRSPLSLQQKKENYFTLKILCNKSIFQENKTPMTPPSQPECTTEIQWFLCFRCSKFIQVTAKSSWQFYIRVTSKSSFFTAWQCLKSINKTTESQWTNVSTWANERETSEFSSGEQKASSPHSWEEPSVSQRDLLKFTFSFPEVQAKQHNLHTILLCSFPVGPV